VGDIVKLSADIRRFSNLRGVHGTTTVGLVCRDGTVLATDTRAIAGSYFIAHKNVKKIQKIDDHLAMTIAGAVADAQNVVDMIRYYSNLYKLDRRAPIPVKAAARLASNIFFSARLFPYIADVLVGGYDQDGPSVYNIDLLGSLTEAKFVSTGSGSPVAYGVLESEYREDLTIDEAIELAAKAVIAAIKRNAGTGDGVDIAIITKSGFRELTEQEKRRYYELYLR
jgi:proteasome beta subunit